MSYKAVDFWGKFHFQPTGKDVSSGSRQVVRDQTRITLPVTVSLSAPTPHEPWFSLGPLVSTSSPSPPALQLPSCALGPSSLLSQHQPFTLFCTFPLLISFVQPSLYWILSHSFPRSPSLGHVSALPIFPLSLFCSL